MDLIDPIIVTLLRIFSQLAWDGTYICKIKSMCNPLSIPFWIKKEKWIETLGVVYWALPRNYATNVILRLILELFVGDMFKSMRSSINGGLPQIIYDGVHRWIQTSNLARMSDSSSWLLCLTWDRFLFLIMEIQVSFETHPLKDINAARLCCTNSKYD